MDLSPYLYDIVMKTYVGDRTLYGEKAFAIEANVTIYFTCVNATSRIVLHALGLNISNSSLSLLSVNSSRSLGIRKSWDVDEKRNFLIFHMGESCSPRESYRLSMSYSGRILEDLLAGFYVSSYNHPTSAQKI
jgi:hypothetical protein